MRSVMLIVCSTCIWAQTAPPLERIIKGKQPVTANGTRDLQQFRSAVNGSRTVFQRGGASTVNRYNPLFGNAYGYLGGLEAGAVNPGRRQQLAYAYQDLGDLLGNPNGYNVGQQPLAIQCYQRAMYLMGNGGSSGDLESLAMRLTLLNAPFMMFGQDTRQPTEPERPAVEVQQQNSVDASAAVVQSEAPPAEPDVPAAFTLSVPGRAAVIATVPTSAITTASISPVLAVDAAPTSTASVEAEAPHRRPSVAQRVISRRAGGGNGAAAASATSAHDRKWTATFYER